MGSIKLDGNTLSTTEIALVAMGETVEEGCRLHGLTNQQSDELIRELKFILNSSKN